MANRTKQAVVLVGGKGTRSGFLTAQIPKPMLPVAGKPFLKYLVGTLARHWFEQILFSTGQLGGQIVEYFRARPRVNL